MNSRIIGLTDWFKTEPGAYLLGWERDRFDQAVGDVFGYHALQLGLGELDALHANRMPHRWLAQPWLDDAQPALLAHSVALPFPECSLDLLALPHALEMSLDPHATLREAERVLVPEGRLVISGLNPASLWGLRHRRVRWTQRLGLGEPFLPVEDGLIGYWRLRDWLGLLGFEVESAQFGCYRPALDNARWLDRFAWMERAGGRWWPIFGAVYFVVAVKRVRGTRLLEPAWKARAKRAPAAAVAANRESPNVSCTEPPQPGI
jgi:SAM-dependent methyltransferase